MCQVHSFALPLRRWMSGFSRLCLLSACTTFTFMTVLTYIAYANIFQFEPFWLSLYGYGSLRCRGVLRYPRRLASEMDIHRGFRRIANAMFLAGVPMFYVFGGHATSNQTAQLDRPQAVQKRPEALTEVLQVGRFVLRFWKPSRRPSGSKCKNALKQVLGFQTGFYI